MKSFAALIRKIITEQKNTSKKYINDALSNKLDKTDKAESAKVADEVSWDNISDKPMVVESLSYYLNKKLDRDGQAESARKAYDVSWGNVSEKPTNIMVLKSWDSSTKTLEIETLK